MRLSDGMKTLFHKDMSEEEWETFLSTVKIGGKPLGDCTQADLIREEERLEKENRTIQAKIVILEELANHRD